MCTDISLCFAILLTLNITTYIHSSSQGFGEGEKSWERHWLLAVIFLWSNILAFYQNILLMSHPRFIFVSVVFNLYYPQSDGDQTSQTGVNTTHAWLGIACPPLPLPSHGCCSIPPWTFRGHSCAPAFSKMGADSKEQRHSLAQPRDASASCGFSGPHHGLGKQRSFSPSLPSRLLTELFHSSFPFTTGA